MANKKITTVDTVTSADNMDSIFINAAGTLRQIGINNLNLPQFGGILSIEQGGTNMTTNPSMLTNLDSTSAASVFAASPRPGVTGTLKIGNGGTGATTAAGARTNLGFTYSDSVPTTTPSTGAGSVHFVQDTGAPTSIENGGTGATSVEELREKLGFGNIGKACSARSTTQNISLTTAGTMYTVPLNAWVSRTTEDFEFSGNGIKCPYTGTVLITGGTYIADQTNAKHGAYVFKNSTEVAAYYFPTVSSVTSTILSVSAGDVIYLKARSSVANASCNGNNSATLLSIVYLK